MRLRLTIAALSAAALGFVALPAAARPYLMLSADDQGFQALDMGNVKRTPEGPNPEDRSIVNHSPPPPRPGAQTQANGKETRAEGEIRARADEKFVLDQVEAGRLPGDRIAPAARAEVDAAPVFVPDTVEVTVIDAFLAGAPYGDKVAPLVERRVEVDCAQDRWRTLSSTFVDAHEAVMADGSRGEAWRPFDGSVVAPVIQAAACKRQYRQAAVSRFLNIGEILANYQAAHSAGVPQPKTREQLLAERAKASR